MKSLNRRVSSKAISCVVAFALLANLCLIPGMVVNAQSYPTTQYEAENATLYNVTTNNNHSGYTGTGFVDGYGDVGDYVQFSITVSSAEDITLLFRYANYTGTTNQREVYLDGSFVSNAYFADTGSWNSWGTSNVGINSVSAGTHTIKLAVNNSTDGFINLDNLVISQKHDSVRSLYMSNWQDSMAIWKASKLSDNDTASTNGPCISELHNNSNWSINQIHDYSGFFRDETNSAKYDQIHNFDSEGYYDTSGILHTNYLTYNGASLPGMQISKDYVFVPNQDIMVTRYTLTNTSSSNLTYSILDQLHPNNTTSNNVSESYDSTRSADIVNMSAASQPYMALGTFTAPTYYQVANDSDSTLTDTGCAGWYTFDNNGTLNDNTSVTAQNVDAGFVQRVTVAAKSSQYVYFYLAIGSNLSTVDSACDTARAQTGAYWFTNTATSYSNWFSGKTIPNLADPDLTTTYKANLIMIKNAIRPGTSTGDGAMPASTNPLAYGYKIWARDSAVTAMALDSAGFTTEGTTYWNWLAARQNSDGTFHTCFGLWDNTNQNFVEPEDDSIGMFLIGVYKHYQKTGTKLFLDSLYNNIKLSANYIANNIGSNGFGPADKSIWEQGSTSEDYAYTQAAYAAGLKAAAIIATIEGDTTSADNWNGASSTIETAINRDDTTSGNPGLWNTANGYYDEYVDPSSNTVNSLEDTSIDILYALGVIDPNSSRASSTIAKFETTLAKNTYGLPRYPGDTFYYTSPYSPSGNEALEYSPTWPQMTMWDSVFQSYSGNTTKAYNMLEWFKHTCGVGFMVTGEAMSNVTLEPCVSTASEPVTAASYVLACLAYAGSNDTRVYASESNAACYTSINVTSTPSNDWSQYKYVPYYVDAPGDTQIANGQTDIKKVYISNDANNIYIRVNNEAGTLPTTTSSPSFKITAYTESFGSSANTTTSSVNGTALGRNMAYMFTKANTDTTYSKYTVSGSNWTFNKSITSVVSPQWDTTTGGLEMVIPRSEIGSPINNTWGHITVVLEQYNGSSYVDNDSLRLNYRLTANGETWFYGNFE